TGRLHLPRHVRDRGRPGPRRPRRPPDRRTSIANRTRGVAVSPLAVALPAAFALLVAALFPCLLATLRGEPVDRLSGLILAGPAATLALLLLAAGYGRPAYLDAA